MRRSDDELRALWQQAVRDGAAGDEDGSPAGDCPDAEVLAAALRGQGPQEERERIADHLVRCPSCAAAAREHRELAAWAAEAADGAEAGMGEGGVGEGGAGSRSGSSPRSLARRAAAVAAGITIAVLAAYGLWQTSFPVEPTTPLPRDVQRGEAGVRPASGDLLPTAPQRLDWPAEPGATGYRVHLYDARAEPAWTSPTLQGPGLDLPAEVRARLAPGTAWSWSVEVLGPARRRELGPFWFRLEEGR